MSKQRSYFVRVFLFLVFVFLVLNLFQDVRSQAQLLPDDEVQTLGQIFSRLNNDYWSTTVDQYICRTGNGLKMVKNETNYGSYSNVTCDCTFNNSTICHITEIKLWNLRINAELPIDFANLTYLRKLDLTRNYFKGFIPRQWTSLPLVYLFLMGNLITGTIPKEIGNIRTLEELSFQDNKMEGSIPIELGNLVNLREVYLGGNDYTGVLPDTFGNLKNLTRFWINGVSLSGKIPEFIGNWTKLASLDMQGTSMKGPIPSNISLLTKLWELRISDLRVSNFSFPDLRDLTNLEQLVLRNCSITGPIPLYIGQNLKNISNLDLSFNKLNGTVPDNLSSLRKLVYMYLTSNSLTGPVPQWSDTKQYIDISYNNFIGSSQSTNCQANYLKSVAIYSSLEDNSIDWCLKKDLPCPIKSSHYELFINCGGRRSSFKGKQYEQDAEEMGPSAFISNEKWACSTTGDKFQLSDQARYIATSTCRRNNDIYSSARLAPVSLRYYGHCLIKGSYTVKLHFAEIELIADPTNHTRAWGKRIFDIYIQGDRVLSDFNIAEEAGGICKGIDKVFTTNVIGNTLEIHLYWSGKGTIALSRRGVYGPLISAISVTPNFDPPTEISAGAIAGIVVASVVVVVLIILALLWKKGYVGGKYLEGKGDIPTGPKPHTNVKVLLESYKFLALQRYKYSDITAMTKSFKHILGQGGYGRVFKGTLHNDGRFVAVKVLNESKGNGEEFINEVATIGRTNHVNVVSLLGFCIEGTKRALVYEFMPNGSLEKYIYNENTSSRGGTHLGWEKLYQIALGIARGLEYFHCRCNTRILHFDIKPHNILLDNDFLPKISDFGLAKLCPTKESIVSMVGARGTMGYIAPELNCRNLGGVSHKSDVYSYGMMVLEMVGSRKNLDITVENMSGIYFPHWIYNQLKRDFEIEEPEEIKLEGAQQILKDESAKEMVIVALWCIQTHPANRPSMTKVVEMLEESNELLEMPPNPSLDPLPLS